MDPKGRTIGSRLLPWNVQETRFFIQGPNFELVMTAPTILTYYCSREGGGTPRGFKGAHAEKLSTHPLSGTWFHHWVAQSQSLQSERAAANVPGTVRLARHLCIALSPDTLFSSPPRYLVALDAPVPPKR